MSATAPSLDERTTIRRTALLAAAALAVTLALLAAGALVSSRQAAGAIPDWPLSHGHLLPRYWHGNAFYASLHRVLAAAAGLALAALAIAARRAPPPIRRPAYTATALYAVQVILGGIIALRFRPQPIAALHALVAPLVVAALSVTLAAAFRRPNAKRPPWSIALTVLATVQIALGALARHPPSAALRWPALGAHVTLAFVIVLLASIAAARWQRQFSGPTVTAGYLLVMIAWLQIILGLALLLIAPDPLAETWPPAARFPTFHAAHVVLSSLILSLAATLAARPR